jgi:hypothetical protein
VLVITSCSLDVVDPDEPSDAIIVAEQTSVQSDWCGESGSRSPDDPRDAQPFLSQDLSV